MSFELRVNQLTPDVLIAFRLSAGWNAGTPEQAARAVANSLCTVTAVEDGRVIGIGRMIGDGALKNYLEDIVVLPECQGRGVGSAVVRRLLEAARADALDGTQLDVGLCAAKGKEPFYASLGFFTLPTEDRGHYMEQRVLDGRPRK